MIPVKSASRTLTMSIFEDGYQQAIIDAETQSRDRPGFLEAYNAMRF